MLKFRKTMVMACAIFPIIMLCGCSPLIPSNYLGSSAIYSSQKINGHRIRPRLIPISAEMLNTPEGRELLEPAMRPQSYQIGAFDNLNVIVWGHPEVSTIATAQLPSTITTSALGGTNAVLANASNASNPAILVQTDGTIFYPYIGHLKVAGLTVNETQAAIAQRLSRYIRDPQVTVQVAKFRNRNIYVLGEVMSPGMQPLTDKPLTLMEAISGAGGINPGVADPSHIYLVRGSYEHPDIFWLNAETPQALMIAEHFPLQEYDIVYVSSAMLTSWNNFINQVLPNFSTYFTIKGLANR